MNDFAVGVLGHMAGRPGTVVTAPDVAEATGLPASTVSQVLKRLAHGQLVASHRGAHGGYSLARSAAEISVADLVEALEGPVALTACVDGAEGHCGVESVCPMRGGWDRVNTGIRAALDRLEEHTSELQSLMRISYDVLCLKKKNNIKTYQY